MELAPSLELVAQSNKRVRNLREQVSETTSSWPFGLEILTWASCYDRLRVVNFNVSILIFDNDYPTTRKPQPNKR